MLDNYQISSDKIETDFDDFYIINDKLMWRIFNNRSLFCKVYWEQYSYDNGAFNYGDSVHYDLKQSVILPAKPEIVLSYIDGLKKK